MRWECTLTYMEVSPFLWDRHALQRRARSVPCTLCCLLSWGVPPLLVWHALRWERKLPYRGVPPLSLALTARRERERSVPPPPPTC